MIQRLKRGDLVRLKHDYRTVGPMNLWDDWRLLTDDQIESFRYLFENDVAIVLATKKNSYDFIRGIKVLSSRGEIGWISENLLERLKS